MPRLPQPGGDEGNWGTILNEFLAAVHKTDGTLKDNTVTSAALAPDSVTTSAIAPGAVDETSLAPSGGADNDVLVKDSASPSGMSWRAPSGGGSTVADASTTQKGVLQLSGDISGTATSVTVSRVNGVSISGTPTSGQVLTATGTSAASWQAPSGGGGAVTSVAGKTGAVTLAQADVANLTSDLAAKAADASVVHVTGVETIAGVKTFSSSPVVPAPTTGTQAANKAYVDSVASSGAPDATTTSNGLVRLAGDLGGTAAAPTISSLKGVSISGAPTSGQVLTATGTSAASWQTPSGGGGGWVFTFRTVTANTTIANHEYILADASSAGINVTLPVASAGAVVRVKRTNGGANGVQVLPQAPALIDGSGVGSHVLGNQWDAIEFVSDGTNWYRN